ncbi:MAG: hypothetical protein PHY45_00205 [Rhodocyclaceae bacterium]|nr:hypothetical protein [Rhodocyclaceae bacterium]
MVRRVDVLVLDGREAINALGDHKIAAAMKKRLAAGGGDFEAYFQPQVDICSGLPRGVEALARWRPDAVNVSPRQSRPGDLLRMVTDILASENLCPGDIELEIAIDAFGTGMSTA